MDSGLKAVFFIILMALFSFSNFSNANVSFSRRASAFEASWFSAAGGLWAIQDSEGHICTKGPISPGKNNISVSKLSSSTDIVLNLYHDGAADIDSYKIPGKISLSPLPKVTGSAVIYQLAPRTYFAQGVGKERSGRLDELTFQRLRELKLFGVDYLWLTGVLEHASTDNTDVDVVKGDAGSYYAIYDKWDVAAALGGLQALESLIQRAHESGIRVLIDLVANHTARSHSTDIICKKHLDFGTNDRKDSFFSPQNNYFYLPGKIFYPPQPQIQGYGDGSYDTDLGQDGVQHESPARVSGNDVTSSSPLFADWFETTKLNYGWNFVEQQEYFSEQPRTWKQIVDVATYWVKKGVDGFRVDYAHAVPLSFWRYFVREVRKTNPHVFLLAEAYESDQRMKIPGFSYKGLLETGFDSIYDSELYWSMYLEAQRPGNMRSVQFENSPASQVGLLEQGYQFTRYMENHDEVRVASQRFLPTMNNPEDRASLGIAYTAYLGLMPGHLMIHGGQEFREDASVYGAFAGDNGRTSIFDYVYQSQTWKWMYGSRSKDLTSFRDRYVKLANLKRLEPFNLVHLPHVPSYLNISFANQTKEQSKWIAGYLRFNASGGYLVVLNSDPHNAHTATLHFTTRDGEDSANALRYLGIENSEKRYIFTEVFSRAQWQPQDPAIEQGGIPGWVLFKKAGIPSGLYLGAIPPSTTYVFKIEPAS